MCDLYSQIDRVLPHAIAPGDKVAVVAPAGRVDRNALDYGIAALENKGLRVWLGPHILDIYGHLAGTDADRAADLMAAFLNPEIKAVFCARGGSGSARILKHLDLMAISHHPKVFVGYSDVTVLHLAIQHAAGWPTFYGPMVASDLATCSSDTCFQALWRLISNPEPYETLNSAALGVTIIPGVVDGVLTGGTLCLVDSSIGTSYAARPGPGIMALEDTGEPLWRVDRMLTHLGHAGLLQSANGFLIGNLADTNDPDDTNQELTIDQIINDHLGGLGKPVITGFPFGHIESPLTLPLNCRVRMDATSRTVTILEPAVRNYS